MIVLDDANSTWPSKAASGRLRLHELGVDALLHDDATRSRAALAESCRSAPEAAFDGQVEVGNRRARSWDSCRQFQRTVLEALRGGSADNADRPQWNQSARWRDFGMLHQRASHCRTESADNVDYALGHARIGKRRHQVVSGERCILGGLITQVLPQTMAGRIFHDGIAMGKFHGVIMPQTPMGVRTAMANLLGNSEGVVGPNMRRPSPAK